jgi:hypothetical protein
MVIHVSDDLDVSAVYGKQTSPPEEHEKKQNAETAAVPKKRIDEVVEPEKETKVKKNKKHAKRELDEEELDHPIQDSATKQEKHAEEEEQPALKKLKKKKKKKDKQQQEEAEAATE